MKKPKYTGELLTPIRGNEGIAAEMGGIDHDEWLEGEYIYRLSLLLDHYKINRKSRTRWRDLSIKLAISHGIPGFQISNTAPIKRGRPPKSKNVLQIQLRHFSKKKRGRPKKYSDEFLVEMVSDVDKRKTEISKEYDRKATDKEVLIEIITYIAKQEKKASEDF